MLIFFCFQASFVPNTRSKFGYFCGGALISQRSVVTGEIKIFREMKFNYWLCDFPAAHCVQEDILAQKKWKLNGVRLGEWNLRTNPDCDNFLSQNTRCAPPVVDLRIAQTIIHERFQPFSSSQENDIALLSLERIVEFNDFVRPICLPSPSTFTEEFDNIPLIVAGFGKTENSDSSKIKLKTEIRGLSNNNCQRFYNSDKPRIAPTQMCALGEIGKDSW